MFFYSIIFQNEHFMQLQDKDVSDSEELSFITRFRNKDSSDFPISCTTVILFSTSLLFLLSLLFKHRNRGRLLYIVDRVTKRRRASTPSKSSSVLHQSITTISPLFPYPSIHHRLIPQPLFLHAFDPIYSTLFLYFIYYTVCNKPV